MRRTLLPLFALCLVFGLVGCDDAPSATPSEAAPATSPKVNADEGPVTDATPAEGTSCCKKDGAECTDPTCGEDCACKQGEAKTAAKAACVCKAGKAGDPVWCESCDKGYVDGKEVCCPSCVKKAVKKAAKTEQ